MAWNTVKGVSWIGDYHRCSPYERSLLQDRILARPENDVLILSPMGRELLWHPNLKGRNALIVLHVNGVGRWVQGVKLGDVLTHSRVVVASPDGGGSLLCMTNKVLMEGPFHGDPEQVHKEGRIVVKFRNPTPLYTHSELTQLFDGENPHNPTVYSF